VPLLALLLLLDAVVAALGADADALAEGANCCRAPRIRCIRGDPPCDAVASLAFVLSPVAAESLPPLLRPLAARWLP
jgi:hypothetical protein